MHKDFTILFTPDKTDWQPTAQFTTGSLIANASLEPGAYHMQFGLCHGSFQAKQQSIITDFRSALNVTRYKNYRDLVI
jgi:hypothetical protein